MFKWSDTDKIVLPVMLVAIIFIAVFLWCLLKGKNEKIRKIPLQIIAVIVIMLEISKQVYYLTTTYITYALPIHFCTLVLILMPLSQFLPKKVAEYFKSPTLVFSLIISVLIYIHPKSMIGDATATIFTSFPSFHTFAFHFCVVAYSIFSIALNDYTPRLKHCFVLCGTVAFYGCYAVPLAFSLNANYVNILYSYFEPLEQFRQSCGQVAYDILLFLIGVIGSCLVLILYWSVFNLIKRNKEKKL